MMYEMTASPEAGAIHVSVTELPIADALRLIGVPTAAAPAADFVPSRAPEKQRAPSDPCRQRANASSLPEGAAGSMSMPKEPNVAGAVRGCVVDGAVGADERPHAAAAMTNSTRAQALRFIVRPPMQAPLREIGVCIGWRRTSRHTPIGDERAGLLPPRHAVADRLAPRCEDRLLLVISQGDVRPLD